MRCLDLLVILNNIVSVTFPMPYGRIVPFVIKANSLLFSNVISKLDNYWNYVAESVFFLALTIDNVFVTNFFEMLRIFFDNFIS